MDINIKCKIDTLKNDLYVNTEQTTLTMTFQVTMIQILNKSPIREQSERRELFVCPLMIWFVVQF